MRPEPVPITSEASISGSGPRKGCRSCPASRLEVSSGPRRLSLLYGGFFILKQEVVPRLRRLKSRLLRRVSETNESGPVPMNITARRSGSGPPLFSLPFGRFFYFYNISVFSLRGYLYYFHNNHFLFNTFWL